MDSLTSTASNWHQLKPQAVLEALATSESGLTPKTAEQRLKTVGENVPTKHRQIGPISIFIRQFSSLLIWLLFAAALFSALIGHITDAFAITLIVFINAIVGFVQEYKAELALQELARYSAAQATVIRDHQQQTIPASQIVPGDIILLKSGNLVPADARLLTATALQINEAALTGESNPVTKQDDTINKDIRRLDARNLVFSGTSVASGKAMAVVYGTGDSTEFGKISKLVQTSVSLDTPLQNTLRRLGQTLALISIAIAVPAMIIGIGAGRDSYEMMLLAVSLAVSAIPEGLPIVVTITLALGARRLFKKNALIRKLPAVEGLGSTDVICTDKTGTLTQNIMAVTRIWTLADGVMDKTKLSENKRADHRQLSLCAVLCNDAQGDIGDPTEQALLQINPQFKKVRDRYKRVDEVPFDSDSKFMITINQVDSGQIAYIKGAPEVILKAASHIQDKNSRRPLTAGQREKVTNMIEQMTKNGRRVLAFGYKKDSSKEALKKPASFTLLGLVGMIDPPRPSVANAIKQVNNAGVRVIMVTGDHPATAGAIAREIGLEHKEVVTGAQLAKMDRQQLEEAVKVTNVFARVTAEQKITILRTLNIAGHKVAMTGDGANDAPALKEAHVGIAVGSGTDLAKEIADMILLDDNFATIAVAIREGRGIFANIKKFVTFLIAANFDEILSAMAAILLGTPLPMAPIHLLWLNVVTDSLPALSLAVDPYPKNLMKLKPINTSRELLQGVLSFSTVAGLLGFLATFGSFIHFWTFRGAGVTLAQTTAFTVTVLFELWLVFAVRSQKSMFEMGIFSNKWLIASLVGAILLQLFAVYMPFTHHIFSTVPIPPIYWLTIIPLSLSGLLIIELIRYLKYQRGIELKLPNFSTTPSD